MKYQCIIENYQDKLPSCQHGFMGISIGSHEQSGRKLSAIIDFVLEHFSEKPFTFFLCDSLNAHNIIAMNNISLLEARKHAVSKADLWLADNKKYLDKLKPHHIIARWDEYLYNQKYTDAWYDIKGLYDQDLLFRQIVFQDVDEHIDRIIKNKNIEMCAERLLLLKQCSINYLLEECAGLAIAFDVKDYNNVIEFYPGNLAKCLGYFERKAMPVSLNALSLRRTEIIQYMAQI